MAEDNKPDPWEELHNTKEALDDVEHAISDLAKASARSKAWMVLMAIVVAISLLAAGVSFGTAVYARGESRETDRELREFGNRLFLSACETTNENRARDRENNTAAAEALILVTNADVRQPEIAAEYRLQIAELNRNNPNRDCRAELAEVTEEVSK